MLYAANCAKEMARENEGFKLQADEPQTCFDCDLEKMAALGYPGAKIYRAATSTSLGSKASGPRKRTARHALSVRSFILSDIIIKTAAKILIYLVIYITYTHVTLSKNTLISI